MRIELVGGMACGKTTLAEQLEKKGAVIVKEEIAENPFLEDCFEDFETFKFPCQMWFALERYSKIGMYEDIDNIVVHDQASLNCEAYTHLMYKDEEGLDSEGRDLILDTFEFTTDWFGFPTLLINIMCTPEEQLKRIKARGRPHEQEITKEFLEDLSTEIDSLVVKAHLEGQEIIYIDATNINFLEDQIFVDTLWDSLVTQFETTKSVFETLNQINQK